MQVNVSQLFGTRMVYYWSFSRRNAVTSRLGGVLYVCPRFDFQSWDTEVFESLKNAGKPVVSRVSGFWPCPRFGSAKSGRFSLEMDGEASHTNGLRDLHAGFWCPRLSQLFEEKPLRLCKGVQLFMHELV